MIGRIVRNFVLALALWSGCAHLAVAQPSFPRTVLTVGMYRIDAEVAATPQTREHGLMFRETMPKQQGMVFAFPSDARHCMWMRNTLLPLAVAFMDRNGAIINIEEMQPRTEVNHCAKRDARYALEMNAGWFRERGFGPGTMVLGLESLVRPY